jgi:hypothetical protein
LKDVDKDGNNRASFDSYTIPAAGTPASPHVINLKQVRSMDGCKLQREVSYQSPWDEEEWIEIREEPGIVDFDFETAMTVTITFDQPWYIHNHYSFYEYPMDTTVYVMP